MPLVPVNADNIAVVEIVTRAAVPVLLCSIFFFVASTRTLCSAYLVHEDTSAHAAAEYGRPLSGPGASSTAAGGCTNAVLHLDRWPVFIF